MVDSLFNYSLLNSLLVKDLEIPIFVEKEFTVQCCIRGYHTYQAQWNAEVGAKLNTAPDTRPAALVKINTSLRLNMMNKRSGTFQSSCQN